MRNATIFFGIFFILRQCGYYFLKKQEKKNHNIMRTLGKTVAFIFLDFQFGISKCVILKMYVNKRLVSLTFKIAI
jgi:cytochrome bd-type quinol oxidase subunit 1